MAPREFEDDLAPHPARATVAWVWLAVGKETGRGEGSSVLAFGRLVDVK